MKSICDAFLIINAESFVLLCLFVRLEFLVLLDEAEDDKLEDGELDEELDAELDEEDELEFDVLEFSSTSW